VLWAVHRHGILPRAATSNRFPGRTKNSAPGCPTVDLNDFLASPSPFHKCAQKKGGSKQRQCSLVTDLDFVAPRVWYTKSYRFFNLGHYSLFHWLTPVRHNSYTAPIRELVADKLPRTLNRTLPLGLITPLLMGGVAGACVTAAGGQGAFAGGVLGALVATRSRT
jgi:hypothetical protein